MSAEPRYSVVVPVYGNRDSIPELISQLGKLQSELGDSLEAVFVVDGSPDDSRAELERELAGGRLDSVVIDLSRNFGSFSAIRVGLGIARGDFVAVMAADLQEPIEAIEAFLRELNNGNCDVVIGRRIARSDPGVSKVSARLFWGLYRRLINRDIPAGGVDVFACSRPVAQQLASFGETNTSLVGLLFWAGYRRSFVEYERQERHSGKSGWTFRKKARYLVDSVYSFTDLPILALQLFGAIGFIVTSLVSILVLAAWFAGAISVPGYTPVMLVMTGSVSLILWGLGVVGSYVWRAYENSKGRPVALVMSQRRYGRDSEAQGEGGS